MTWADTYKESGLVWGEKPDLLLADLLSHLPPGRVLDLGMGEGRNGIFFAQHGFDVQGIDKVPAAVATCRERAQSLNVPFRAELGDIREVAIEADSFVLVICAMSLQFMKLAESLALMESITRGLRPGGMVYITAFSTDDPGFDRSKSTRPELERNTFFFESQDTNVHYFEKDEILTAFSDLTLHRFAQSIFLDSGHPGASEPHYHGTLTFIGQKI